MLEGDLAHRYGIMGNLADISFSPAQPILGAGTFGTAAHNLQAIGSPQDRSDPVLS